MLGNKWILGVKKILFDHRSFNLAPETEISCFFFQFSGPSCLALGKGSVMHGSRGWHFSPSLPVERSQVSESLVCSGWKRPSGPNLLEHRQVSTLWQHVLGYWHQLFFLLLFFSFRGRMHNSSSSHFMQYRRSRPQCLRCFLLSCAKELWSWDWQYRRLTATTSGRSVFFKFEKFQTLVLEISFPNFKQLKFNESSA